MVRSALRALLGKQPGEMEKLLADAHRYPRHTSHTFQFRGLQLRVTDFLSVAHQLLEYFEEEQMKFKTDSALPVIYDCGANVGVSALYFKKLFPHAVIKAFEPDPSVFECLQSNLKNNGIENVTLYDKAVWINNEGITFGSEGADAGSVYGTDNRIQVPTIRLKDLLQQEERVDCLKMDIEGAENDVIADCSSELKKIKYLFVEYHSWISQKQNLSSLLALLEQNGFRYYLQSIGNRRKQPFLKQDSGHPMDVQLDIHAVNEHLTE